MTSAEKMVKESWKVHDQAWVQVGQSNQLVVRAIYTVNQCPKVAYSVVEKNFVSTMNKVVKPSQDFPFQICQKHIPINAVNISVDGKKLPSFPKEIKRIAVVGDTGCRLKGKYIQNCSDSHEWPFARVAEAVHDVGADMVVHVGDYHYRESPCPKGDKRCAGSVDGDNWASWNQDFFSHARPLLDTAPVVFVRGNHEECKRAGHGWNTFFADPLNNKKCRDYTDEFNVRAANINLFVLDTSRAFESHVDLNNRTKELKFFRKQFQNIHRKISADQDVENILVTHKPMWGLHSNTFITRSLQLADRRGGLMKNLDLFVAGHIHLYEMLSFQNNKAPQLIVGNSGTELVDLPINYTKPSMFGQKVPYAHIKQKFGFVLLEKKGRKVWNWTVYDPDGNVLKIGKIDHKKVS